MLLVYGWFAFTHLPATSPTIVPTGHVLGASANITLFEQPESGRKPILDAIATARQEILVEVYLLSDKQIIQALEDAAARGVVTEVMLEQHPFRGSSLNPTTKKELDNHGVSTEWANSSFSLTHEKAIVIDTVEAFILNQNLTTAAFTKNREYDVIDTNPEDVAEIRKIFIADWERTSVTPSQSSHLVVSPTTSRQILTSLVNSAKGSIDIEIEDIVDDQITSLLSSEATHMQIRIIIPTLSQISSNASDIKKLQQSGVSVKTFSAPYIHAKLILIDNAKAYVVSINLSTQSMDHNRELGIILTQSDILGILENTFESDWNNAQQLTN